MLVGVFGYIGGWLVYVLEVVEKFKVVIRERLCIN